METCAKCKKTLPPRYYPIPQTDLVSINCCFCQQLIRQSKMSVVPNANDSKAKVWEITQTVEFINRHKREIGGDEALQKWGDDIFYTNLCSKIYKSGFGV